MRQCAIELRQHTGRDSGAAYLDAWVQVVRKAAQVPLLRFREFHCSAL